jgi:general secretion pathway protein M
VGAVVLAGLLAWALVWDPFARDYRRLQEVVAEQRDLAAWMEGAVAQVRRLQAGGSGPVPSRGDESFLALVDRTTKARGLAGAVKRVQPEGADKVRVWLEGASFDVMVTWLGQLSAAHGVRVTGAAIEGTDTPGRVDARLTLATGGA